MKRCLLPLLLGLVLSSCDFSNELVGPTASVDAYRAQPYALLNTTFPSQPLALFGFIGTSLVKIDLATGDATEIGVTTNLTFVTAMTFDSNTNVLYAIGLVGSDPHLVSIDRTSGDAALVGPITVDGSAQDVIVAEGLAFNASDGVLYAAVGTSSANRSNRLVTLDPTTATATHLAGISGSIEGEADALAWSNGTLYAVDIGLPNNLYTLNPASGVATFVGNIGGTGGTSDLAFNPNTQTLYGNSRPDQLLTISQTTGTGTLVGQTHQAGEFNDDLFVALSFANPGVLSVMVDIKPGSNTNPINLKSKGNIPVAILTSAGFNATMVDPLSVAFGPDGAMESHGKGHIEDIDGDGDDDLLLHFRTKETGIESGDEEACLTGATFDGNQIEGCDTIQTKGVH